MKVTVPPSTQILLIIALFTAFVVFTGEIPSWLTWAAVIYVGLKAHDLYSTWCQQLDHPPPKLYDLEREGVWAQVEQAIKLLKNKWKTVNMTIDYSDPEPPEGQPIFIQATIFIHHPYLQDVKQHMSAANQDLKSKVIFKAYIEGKKDKSELRIECETQPIMTRIVENNIIQTLLTTIDELVVKQLPKPKQ